MAIFVPNRFKDMFFFGWQEFWGPKWQKFGKMTILSRKIMNITWYFIQSIVLGYYDIQYIWKVKFVSTYWENIPFVFLNIVVDRINLDGCTSYSLCPSAINVVSKIPSTSSFYWKMSQIWAIYSKFNNLSVLSVLYGNLLLI